MIREELQSRIDGIVPELRLERMVSLILGHITDFKTDLDQAITLTVGFRPLVDGRQVDDLPDPVSQKVFDQVKGILLKGGLLKQHSLIGNDAMVISAVPLDPEDDFYKDGGEPTLIDLTKNLRTAAPPSPATRSLKVNVSRLEDHVPEGFLEDYDAEPTDISAAAFEWLQAFAAAASDHPDMQDIEVNGNMTPGDLNSVDIILLSPSAMSEIFGHGENCIGVHQITTPDGDPFGDDGEARKYRVLVPFSAEWVLGHIRDTSPDDLEDGAMAWLTTFTHELHHVRLFAENSGFNSPADIDAMQSELDHDLFDFSSGYGIRPLMIEGMTRWSETVKDARDDMETYVEDRGIKMNYGVFGGRLGPREFLETLGAFDVDLKPN